MTNTKNPQTKQETVAKIKKLIDDLFDALKDELDTIKKETDSTHE